MPMLIEGECLRTSLLTCLPMLLPIILLSVLSFPLLMFIEWISQTTVKPQPQPRVSRSNSSKPALPAKPVPAAKPCPPIKPPRSSIESSNSGHQRSSQMHQSKSQRNLATYEEIGGSSQGSS